MKFIKLHSATHETKPLCFVSLEQIIVIAPSLPNLYGNGDWYEGEGTLISFNHGGLFRCTETLPEVMELIRIAELKP